LTNPSQSRYYILDALGHTRLLLDNAGNVTDTYVYDAWGNLLKGSEFNTPNPFTWNGAYGYEWIEFTGLFHVGAREYDPRTARWLQRDPIGVAGGHPNVYLYCGNEPVNSSDPSGTDQSDAIVAVSRYAPLIDKVSKKVGIQPALLAGVVWVESYAGGVPSWRRLNNQISVLKFLSGRTATIGITQYGLDPSKILGCDTFWGRRKFIADYLHNPEIQLELTAKQLKYLAQLAYGKEDFKRLNATQVAMVLSAYNRGDEYLKIHNRPSVYGMRFLRHRQLIGLAFTHGLTEKAGALDRFLLGVQDFLSLGCHW
jgi:RHS repeat-associated protein